MIGLMSLLKEVQGKPKAIFMAGPAGSGKSFILQRIVPSDFNVINVDDTYEELLKSSGIGMKLAQMSPDELKKAGELMGQARKATDSKYQDTTQNLKNLYLIAGICEQYQQELNKRNLGYQILFWDYSVGCVWESYKDRLDQVLPWNSSAGRFLFLTGVPSRPNRIGLLSKFYDKKLLSKGSWSFFPPWTDEDKTWCREHLKCTGLT